MAPPTTPPSGSTRVEPPPTRESSQTKIKPVYNRLAAIKSPKLIQSIPAKIRLVTKSTPTPPKPASISETDIQEPSSAKSPVLFRLHTSLDALYNFLIDLHAKLSTYYTKMSLLISQDAIFGNPEWLALRRSTITILLEAEQGAWKTGDVVDLAKELKEHVQWTLKYQEEVLDEHYARVVAGAVDLCGRLIEACAKEFVEKI